MPSRAQSRTVNLLSETNIKKHVLPHYDLENSTVCQIKFKDTDKQRAVYKIENQTGIYCLKKVYFPFEDLLFVYSAIEWLIRYGIHIPRILPTKKNERFVVFENMLFLLTPWIEGIKCDYDILQHVLDSSVNLATMHAATINFFPISGSHIREGYDSIYTSLNKHFQQLLFASNLAFKYNDAFSKTFLQSFETNQILAQIAVNIASTIVETNLSKALCHLDYVNKNIIFDTQNKLWVIDFDKCKLDYCIHDLSYFLRRLLKRDNTKWDLQLTTQCLDLYDSIHPLTLDEYKSILVTLAFPQKYWKISRDYYNNIKKCNSHSFLLLLQKSVEYELDQLRFTYEFKEYIENKFATKIT